MPYHLSVRQIKEAIVPVSRFSRGEAGRIFDEVRNQGAKIVMKNHEPICILLEPGYYEAMLEALEDRSLYHEAELRKESDERKGHVKSAAAMETLGIRDHDLEDIEVDIKG